MPPAHNDVTTQRQGTSRRVDAGARARRQAPQRAARSACPHGRACLHCTAAAIQL